METQQTNIQNNIREQILLKIKKGEVKMRPKAFFVVKVALLIFLVFVVFVLSVLLVSYTWFNLQAGGHIFLLGFGSRGFFEFFLLFPWFLLVLDIVAIFCLEWLLKRFKFGYHHPVLFVFIGSLLVITIGGTIVNMTSFHKNIMRMAEEHNLPIPGVGGFYSDIRKTHEENGLFRGQIISIATSSFVIKEATNSPNSISMIIMTPLGFNPDIALQVGDEVFVAGDIVDGYVSAYGIKKLTTDD